MGKKLKNNLTIDLNVLYAKNDKICPTYVSKYNSKRKEQVIPLMIPNKEGWHCIAVKNLSSLLRGVTSKYNGDYYCLNCLHSFRTKNKLELHIKACENKYFCNFVMPSEDTKILEFNQYRKSGKSGLLFILTGNL